MTTAVLSEELICSICLNIYVDPVMLRCGHNYCRVCIERVLGTQEGHGVYSCPECRDEFQERPDLPRNITLCNIIERCISSPPKESTEGIFCSYCVHSSVAAVKSCLLCEASLCEEHLRVHSKSPEHVLSEPSNSLQSRKCSTHKKILEYYCTQDALCICVTCCLAGEHKGHKVEQLMDASNKKKEMLKTILTKMLAKRAEIKDRVQSLQERRRAVQERATGMTETITGLFEDLRRQLEDLEKRVLNVISTQEDQVSISVSDLIQQLEIKKHELSEKMRHIESLCNTSDPLIVLNDQESGSRDFCDTEKADDEERKAYNEKFQNIGGLDEGLVSVTLQTGLANIVSCVKIAVDEEKAEGIEFDMNTAFDQVNVSDGYTISWSKGSLNWPKTPETFQTYPQVLSTKTLSSGKHYFEWEVGYLNLGCCSVGMCYPSIDRKGESSCIGYNDKSWCLWMFNGKCSVIHNSSRVHLPHIPNSSRFRMYLDYEAGQLSFYELCDPIRHLHTFSTIFTEPLHVACYVCRPYISIIFK
ncbi:E3 ubiquitin/ISG15 ligase TRIM25-like [Bufo bufo]|uniref:E3 ubiquitin/ISG15 ligase TRIM25-like n=1 Tax=Bufo bufo TaxID=8384 RepID=UPI001ABE8D04|nr:E3 ubiquitin/ISG15 ligase TRIM25-like [Bufo bufo]